MPLISIILPVYNSEKYIYAAVQSMLDQTFTDFELIVINDASTDGTLDILRNFNDPRIRLINNETNLKVVKCLNRGIDLAKGEFIARMDADDISYPQRLEKQLAYLQSHPDIDLCATWVKVFGADDFIHYPYEDHELIKTELLFLNIIRHPTIMFRRKPFIENKVYYNELYINCEDYGLWVELIDRLKFATLQEVLLEYRIHEKNTSIPQSKNWNIIKRMNFMAYQVLLKRMGVEYSEDELELHLNLGFKHITHLKDKELVQYLEWLKKLARANNRSKYFEEISFLNSLFTNLLFLFRKMHKTPINYYRFISAFSSIYSLKSFSAIFESKLKRKLSKL